MPNTQAEKKAYVKLVNAGLTQAGAIGLIGNLEAESDGFYSTRVEYLCRNRMKEFDVKNITGEDYTDSTYTEAIDSGRISLAEFQHPLLNSPKANAQQKNYQYGYGLAQWTSPGRKAALYNFMKERGLSIGDLEGQLDFLLYELRTSYSEVYLKLQHATSIREASDVVLIKYESPADTSEQVRISRASRGETFYRNYIATGLIKQETSAASEIEKIYQIERAEIGYLEKATSAAEYLDDKTANAGANNYTKYWRDLRKLGRLKHFGYDASGSFVGGPDWPYCAAGQEWSFVQALGLARAKELLLHPDYAFINCQDMYAKAKAKGQIISRPQPGVLVLFRRSESNHYHVEFCYRVDGDVMYTIGFNTSGASSVIANGGGVCDKRYTISTTNADYFLPAYKGGTVFIDDTPAASVTYIKYGSKGSAVKAIQEKLIAMGYSCGKCGADGDFGADTLKAVKLFQEHNGCAVDGIVGAETSTAINIAYEALKNNQVLDPVDSERLFVGKIKKNGTDVRSWAGREYGNIKSWPKLNKGNLVDVLDYTQKDTLGEQWYFVRIADKYHGFVHSKDVKRV